MIKQHPTAIVSSKAQIGDNVEIGPYSIIKDDVIIGNGVKIASHVVIYDGARIADNVKIYQSASVSHIPQDLKFNGEQTSFEIGENTVIHEFVTLHRGTSETKVSKVGKNCLLMAYTHVAHDCILGDNVILANAVQIGGHAQIDDFAMIGGSTPMHQFCKVGKHAIVGGGFKISKDVPPYVLAGNWPLKYEGLNLIGLRRRGFTNDDIMTIKKAYQIIYNSGLPVFKAVERIKEELSIDNPYISEILSFIEKAKRGIIGG